FAMMAIIVSSKVIDLVQLQYSDSKLILIFTDKEEEMNANIQGEINRGITKVNTIGGYSEAEKTMLLSVVEQSEAIYIKKLLQEKDPTSFVIFLNASEVLGRGF